MNFNLLSRRPFFSLFLLLAVFRLIETFAPRPGYSSIFLERGVTADQQGNRPQAIAFYKKAMYNDPRNPRSYEQLGRIARNNGQFEKMFEYYQKAIKYESHNPDVYYGLGMYFLDRQDYPKAIEFFFKSGGDIEHCSSQIAYQLGVAYEEQGLYTQAIDALKAAIRKKAQYPEARYHLGICYFKIGDMTNASEQTIHLVKGSDLSNKLRALLGLQ